MHVVARCNNRTFYFTTPEDFDLLLAHLRDLSRSYEVRVYAHTLMSNHVHLLMQAPTHEALPVERSVPGPQLKGPGFHPRGSRGRFSLPWPRALAILPPLT